MVQTNGSVFHRFYSLIIHPRFIRLVIMYMSIMIGFASFILSHELLALVSVSLLITSIFNVPCFLREFLVRKEHYSRLDKEMPFYLSLALIIFSSGLSVDQLFIGSAEHEETKSFSVESKRYLSMRLSGGSRDTCLERLESYSPPGRYKSFIRGLRNIVLTSLRLSEFVSKFFDTYFEQLESLWRDYWLKANGLMESILLLTLSLLMLYISSVLLDKSLINSLYPFLLILILLAGLTGVLLLRTMRPTKSLYIRFGKKLFTILAFPWVASILPIALLEDLRLKTMSLSVTLILGGIYVEKEKRKAYKLEEEVLTKFQKFDELVKSGYDVYTAFRESGLKTDIHVDSSVFETFVSRLVRFVSKNLDRYGVMKEDFVSSMYVYMKRFIDINSVNKSSMTSFMIIGLVLPSLLSALLLGLGRSFLLIDDFLMHFVSIFIMMAITIGMLVSEAVDDFFLFSLKPGIACALLSVVLFIL